MDKKEKISINGQDVEIDSEIKDLVLFINSLDGVTTIGSCQGHDNGGPLGNFLHPYIKFKCSNNRSLGLIASVADIYYDWAEEENSEEFFQNLPKLIGDWYIDVVVGHAYESSPKSHGDEDDYVLHILTAFIDEKPPSDVYGDFEKLITWYKYRISGASDLS